MAAQTDMDDCSYLRSAMASSCQIWIRNLSSSAQVLEQQNIPIYIVVMYQVQISPATYF